MSFAGFMLILCILVIVSFPAWTILPELIRQREENARWRAMEAKRRKAALAEMSREMAVLGLHPSDYTKEQLQQMARDA